MVASADLKTLNIAKNTREESAVGKAVVNHGKKQWKNTVDDRRSHRKELLLRITS